MLRGIVSGTNDWNETPDYGLYYLPMSDTESFIPIVTGGPLFNGVISGYGQDGIYYIHTLSRGRGGVTIVDLANGQVTNTLPSFGYTPYEVAYDNAYEKVYGLMVSDTDLSFGDVGDNSYSIGYIDYSPSGINGSSSFPLSGKYNAYTSRDGSGYLMKLVENNGEVTGVELCEVDLNSGSVYENFEIDEKPQGMGSMAVHPSTRELYWIANKGNGEPTTLWKMDPRRGRPTLVHTYKGCQQILSIEFVVPQNMSAPAEVSNLAANFENGSLTGVLSFTTPATNQDGSKGESLVYAVTDAATGVSLASANCAYGEDVEVPLTVSESGFYEFSVTVADGENVSKAVKLRLYIGNDQPIVPMLKPAIVAEDGTVTLEWLAAEAGINGGYVNPAEITYKVVRYPDMTVVAEAISNLSATDVLPDTERFTAYYYGVSAKFADKESGQRYSEKIVRGYLLPPYENTFRTQDDLTGFVTYNGNGSFYNWQLNSWSGGLEVNGDSSVEMDQWLLTPEMKLERGQNYLLEISAHTNGARIENYELCMGDAQSAEAMTKVLGSAEVMTYMASEPDVNRFWISPEEDGSCYLAIHANSPAGSGRLCIDKFSLSSGIPDSAPGDCGNLSVSRDIKGDYVATIEFTAPDKTFVGDDLESISYLTVCRDGQLIEKFTDVKPGQHLTCVDRTLTTFGEYVYEIQAANEHGAGRTTESEPTFIGMLKPAITSWVEVEELSDGEIRLWWAPITKDINGVDIDPDRVRYHISSRYGNKAYYATDYEGTEITFKAIEDDEPQVFMTFDVIGITDSGWGGGVYSAMLPVGKPIVNFTESFPGGEFSTKPHESMKTIFMSGDLAHWETCPEKLSGVISQDGDGGCAWMVVNEAGATAGFATLKLQLADEKPAMTFWVQGIDDGVMPNENVIAVDVLDLETDSDLLESDRWVEVYSAVVGEIAANEQWVKCCVDLNKYAGKKAQIRLRGIGNSYMYLPVDNISVGSDLLTSVDVVGSSDVAVRVVGQSIEISGETGLDLVVCSVDGRVIYAGNTTGDVVRVAVAPGIFVVKVGDKSYKVAVK